MDDSVCPECKCQPPSTHEGPGVPVPLLGTRHHSWCPTLPHLTREQQEEMNRRLDEMARARHRAYHESANFWIG